MDCMDLSILKQKINLSIDSNIVIVGIGNILRNDDGLGPEVIRRLELLSIIKTKKNILFLDAGMIPENYLSKIIHFELRIIIFIDALNFGSRPGTIKVFEEDSIENSGLSTHNVSINLIISILKTYLSSEIYIIFIG